ncbi:MAG: hypothetical protein HYS27_17710 [Deltaproteobacteria bacterium]|nr:hypothetical protein [Deltaproteobacteria bacterium]
MSIRCSCPLGVLLVLVLATLPTGCRRVVAVEDIAGYWSGDWGDMILQRDGDDVVGAYSHDEGILAGTFANEAFTGWWCEVPSRQANDDAGDVEFTFAYNGDVLELDGRWRYGAEGDLREDWDVTRQGGAGPAELQARIDSGETCPAAQ